MRNELIPPPELAPPSIKHLTVEQKVRLWAQMVDEGDQLVMDGLRRRLGPDADIHAAFLEWLDRRNAEHDRATETMLREIGQRERASSIAELGKPASNTQDQHPEHDETGTD